MKILLRALDRIVCSSANYWTAMFADLAAALAFLALGRHWLIAQPMAGGVLIVAGFVVAGLLEYVLHRWVLHGPPSVARRGHVQHHDEPRALVSAPLLMIAAIALVIWEALSWTLSSGPAALVVFGLYGRYNYFAIVHHVQHRHGLPFARLPYFQRLERLHHLHHHRQVVNFGISTTLWDRVFGTYQPTSKPASNFARTRAVPLSRTGPGGGRTHAL